MNSHDSYLFAGGGSGGHLVPGLAVAEELVRRSPGCRIVFAGSGRAIESSFLAGTTFRHVRLPVLPPGAAVRRPIAFATGLWTGSRTAAALIDELRPAAVIGLGGFASVPVAIAARRRGTPLVLLEQNVVPGRATTWLARRADRVCVSFEETLGHLPRGSRGAMAVDDVDAFEHERPRLVALAYRMLGTVTDADDVVQDAWLRWDRLGAAGRAAVANPAAWCTTVVTRVALDRLRAAKRQREVYVGPWLPEPVATTADPAETVELAESLTLGFLSVLERLGPVERAAFLLADVFGEPYARIADALGRSEDACRQAASRARRRVREVRRGVAPVNAEQLLGAFLGACAQGDVDGLRSLLAADVVLVSDGGAFVHAARRPVVGAHRVTRLLVNVAKRMPPGLAIEPAAINGEAGFVGRLDGVPVMVVNIEEHAGLVTAVRIMVNPDKLRAV